MIFLLRVKVILAFAALAFAPCALVFALAFAGAVCFALASVSC